MGHWANKNKYRCCSRAPFWDVWFSFYLHCLRHLTTNKKMLHLRMSHPYVHLEKQFKEENLYFLFCQSQKWNRNLIHFRLLKITNRSGLQSIASFRLLHFDCFDTIFFFDQFPSYDDWLYENSHSRNHFASMWNHFVNKLSFLKSLAASKPSLPPVFPPSFLLN